MTWTTAENSRGLASNAGGFPSSTCLMMFSPFFEWSLPTTTYGSA